MAPRTPSYKDAMNEIEEIINEIENETLDVDELANKVKRVSKLIKICKEKLYKTEKEVTNILQDIDNE